jgi:hypothetical protein
VVAPTAIDALGAMRAQLRESLLWRQRLPARVFAASDREWLDECRAVFAMLGADLQKQFCEDSALRAFVAELEASRARIRLGAPHAEVPGDA